MNAEPLVDVIIPVHDASRPLARAIESSILNPSLDDGAVRVTVVCHNLAAKEVSDSLTDQMGSRIRLVEFDDGLHSPAGPRNFGISQATARYVSFLDSDDFVEPGALGGWLEWAEDDDLDVLIPRQRHHAGDRIRTPPVRPFRRRVTAVPDRLIYRTAVFGLVRRDILERGKIAYSEGFETGEDRAFSAKLYFSAGRIGYARGLAQYIVGDDAVERVTTKPRPVGEALAALAQLLEDPWFADRTVRERRSMAAAFTRVTIFGAVSARSAPGLWTPEDARSASEVIGALDRGIPGFDRCLSIVDRHLVDTLRDPTSQAARVAQLSVDRRRHLSLPALVCRDLRGQFSVEGPLRLMIASALL